MKPLAPESGPAYLFCPADRPDRYQKAADRADFVIIDLEDAVAPGNKVVAREALANTPIDPDNVIVRINALTSPQSLEDLDVLISLKYRRIVVPKAEDAAAIGNLTGFEVIALCETARGVLAAAEIAAVPTVVGLMWGAEDLIVSLGGRSSRRGDGSYLDVALHARSTVQLASGAVGKPAIDAVYLDMADTIGLETEAREAVASGFTAKACVHPDQVGIVRQAFQPSPEQVSWARQIVESAESGVSRVNGQMVDEPLLVQAQTILSHDQAEGLERPHPPPPPG
jgi:citrate lyase subunit beta/citryl-CoA lyase